MSCFFFIEFMADGGNAVSTVYSISIMEPVAESANNVLVGLEITNMAAYLQSNNNHIQFGRIMKRTRTIRMKFIRYICVIN